MNEPTAEDSANISKPPMHNTMRMRGSSHHFLRSFIKRSRSFKKSISFIFFSLIQILLASYLPSSKLAVGSFQIYTCL